MSDLLDNLRRSSPNEGSHDLHCRCLDAAAEIERLRTQVAAARKLLEEVLVAISGSESRYIKE